MDKVICKFVDKRFYNESNKYTIALYNAPSSSIPVQYRQNGKRKIQFSAVGINLPMVKKYDIMLEGTFRYDEKYGLTLKVTSNEMLTPTDLEGIQQYLTDFIDGCGEKTAKRIVEYFGEDTLNVLNNDAHRLYEVPKLRKFSVDKMIKSYQHRKNLQEIVTLLSPFGVGTKTITEIQNNFDKNKGNKKKNDAVAQIKDNPFIISNYNGISFDTLNTMAIRFNCDLCNEERIAAGIIEVLRLAETRGHLSLPQGELRERALQLLNTYVEGQPVTRDIVTKVICLMAKDHRLLGDNGNAYLADNYYQEDKTARMLCKMLKVRCTTYDTEKYLPHIEEEMKIELSKNQRTAVDVAINNRVSIITGGAGTGKTTVLKAILKVLYKRGYKSEDVLLVAPTGIASQRMSESTGHSASTIHSALGLTVEKEDNISPENSDKLPHKLIVCDEFSMVDMFLTYKLFSAIDPYKTKIVMLGDTGQLPSVGPGNVLHEFLSCGVIPSVELNVIFRQAQENLIVRNSANIRYGVPKVDFDENFTFFEQNNADIAAQMIANRYVESSYINGLMNVQVLSPVKTKGPCSVYELNKRIQDMLNPLNNRVEVQIGMYKFREKDKVMHIKNIEFKTTTDKEVIISNGDTGILLKIFKNSNSEYLFRIDFGDERVVEFNKEDMLNCLLAYSITIHKSQGAEYHHCIIPLLPYFPDAIFFRHLLYTGITRAKVQLEIIGNMSCIYKCITTNKIIDRHTSLSSRILKYYK